LFHTKIFILTTTYTKDFDTLAIFKFKYFAHKSTHKLKNQRFSMYPAVWNFIGDKIFALFYTAYKIILATLLIPAKNLRYPLNLREKKYPQTSVKFVGCVGNHFKFT